MTPSYVKQGLAAACLLGMGGVLVSHAALSPSAIEETAGEEQARSQYALYRDQFASAAPAITAALTAAARAQGQLEGPLVLRAQSRPDDSTGELEGRDYYARNRTGFVTGAAVVTPAQTAAAVAEGRLAK